MSTARASGVRVTASASPRASVTARSMSTPRSSSVSCSRVSSRDRDSSGEMTENDGFSVVAAIRMIQPFSTPGSSASCWAFENRWISSRNSTVVTPYRSRCDSACSSTLRTSATPAFTADSSTKLRPELCATACARVVLPVPGGPHRMTDTAPLLPRLVGGEADERRTGPEQVLLPGDLVEAGGAHPHGERRRAAAKACAGIHGRHRNRDRRRRAGRGIWRGPCPRP